MSDKNKPQLDDLLHETRVFEPPQLFKTQANVNNLQLHQQVGKDRLAFWAECAKKLDWSRPWDTVLQ